MKKISSGSSQCKTVPTSVKSSSAFLSLHQRLRLSANSKTILTLVTFQPALPTLVLVCVHLSTLNFQSLLRTNLSSRRSLTSTSSRFVEFTASTPRAMTALSIFLTLEDSAAMKLNLLKICTTVSRPSSKLRKPSDIRKTTDLVISKKSVNQQTIFSVIYPSLFDRSI